MVEPCRALRFILKAPDRFFVGRIARQDFHRDGASQARIDGPEDRAHAATANEFDQVVVFQALPHKRLANGERSYRNRRGVAAG
jgi:uncharacterized MAPEG superfamily protein